MTTDVTWKYIEYRKSFGLNNACNKVLLLILVLFSVITYFGGR